MHTTQIAAHPTTLYERACVIKRRHCRRILCLNLAIHLLIQEGENQVMEIMRYLNFARLFVVLLYLGVGANNGSAQALAGPDTPRTSAEGSGIPAPSTGTTSSRYTLGAADIIHVNVWKNVDLSQTVTIGPDGFVSLPLLGDVHAAGLTADQLSKDLTSRLASYVVNAQVTVSVVEIRSRQVFITGQVGKPGAYPLIAPITVVQLIAQAGGLNTFANRKGIFILRGTSGNAQRLKFNYASAIHGGIKQNINLQPGDTVIVP
ncbi:MAG: polysaccharide biosynthesis/export family protein [Chthonomonadales bacterium]